MNLAHTCKALKSVVYSIVFKNLLFSKPWDMDSMEVDDSSCFDYWDYDNGELLLGSTNRTQSLQFCLGIGYHRIPESALSYVRTLVIGFHIKRGPLGPRLPALISNMSSLQEVTLHIYNRGDFPDIPKVIESILGHENEISVHTYWEMLISGQLLFTLTLDIFEDEWSDWCKLKNETVFFTLGDRRLRFPTSFLEILKQQKHLKSFCISSDGEVQYGIDPRDIHETVGITAIPRYLQDLPKLEEIKLFMTEGQISDECDWVPAPAIKSLSLPIGMFKPSHTFNAFDHVSYLELAGQDVKNLVMPKFRGLKALVLSKFSKKVVNILEHFVSNNPNLTELCIANCKLSADLEQLTRLFANIEKLELFETEFLTFKGALASAKNLRFFHWYPAKKNSTNYKKVFKWLAEAVKDKEISQSLQTILFQPTEDDKYMFETGADWALFTLPKTIPTKAAKKIALAAMQFDPIASHHGDYSTFIMDMHAFAQAVTNLDLTRTRVTTESSPFPLADLYSYKLSP